MWEVLQRLKREGRLVRIERDALNVADIRGFVGSVSDTFALIHVVTAACHFDGGVVLRTKDVTCLRWGEAVSEARARAAFESPTAPEATAHVDLSSWEMLLPAVTCGEPVVTLHRERADECHVVTAVALVGECVEAEEISPDGSLDGTVAFDVSDLTRVDFGGTFERGVVRMLRPARAVGQ